MGYIKQYIKYIVILDCVIGKIIIWRLIRSRTSRDRQCKKNTKNERKKDERRTLIYKKITQKTTDGATRSSQKLEVNSGHPVG